MTTQSQKSKVMKMAWSLYKLSTNGLISFSTCLKQAWAKIKHSQEKVSIRLAYKFLDNLKFVDAKNTKDYYRIINSNRIRKSEDPEVKELADAGLIPIMDIIKLRRLHSATHTFAKRPERRRRPRIVSSYTEKVCVA